MKMDNKRFNQKLHAKKNCFLAAAETPFVPTCIKKIKVN